MNQAECNGGTAKERYSSHRQKSSSRPDVKALNLPYNTIPTPTATNPTASPTNPPLPIIARTSAPLFALALAEVAADPLVALAPALPLAEAEVEVVILALDDPLIEVPEADIDDDDPDADAELFDEDPLPATTVPPVPAKV